MRRCLYEDFESGECFLIEFDGGSKPDLKRMQQLTPEQYTAARAAAQREDLTKAQRGALIANVLDPMPEEMRKPVHDPSQEKSTGFLNRQSPTVYADYITAAAVCQSHFVTLMSQNRK